MDADFDLDHLARDLSAEARGLTRIFFAELHTAQGPLAIAVRLLLRNKGGIGKVAVSRRMKRFRSAAGKSPNVLLDKPSGKDGGRLVLAILEGVSRSTEIQVPTTFSEPVVKRCLPGSDKPTPDRCPAPWQWRLPSLPSISYPIPFCVKCAGA